MKIILAAILMILFLPLVASAQFDGTEVETWFWDGDAGMWVYQGVGDVTALARCWASLPTQGACNKDWMIPVKVHASIAQWIEWTLSGSRWDWKVRKPGRYGADCITATVKSNQHVLIDYHDFNDLEAESVSVNPFIPIWYHVSEMGAQLPPPDSPFWTRSFDLNNSAEWDTIYDSQQLHDGLQFKLWNMIEVVECNSACEYQDHATISLKLLCQKWWIDRTTGYFIDED
jgi:hypothetical protein